MDTVVITPAYNEEATIGEVVGRVLALGFPSIVVDDGSTDSTSGVARAAGALVIRLPVNLGVGGALRTAFRYASRHGFKRVVQVDADLQHDPNSIPILLEAAERGADMVIGSRFGHGYRTGVRAPAISVLRWMVRRRTGVWITDPTSGFKVVSEPLLSVFADEFPADYLGDTVEALVLTSDLVAHIVEVDVSMSRRSAGEATPATAGLWHFFRVLFALAIGKPGVPRT